MVCGLHTTLLARLPLLFGLFLGVFPEVLFLAQAGFSTVCVLVDVLQPQISGVAQLKSSTAKPELHRLLPRNSLRDVNISPQSVSFAERLLRSDSGHFSPGTRIRR